MGLGLHPCAGGSRNGFRGELDPWLAGENVPFDTYPAQTMTFHPVSTRVNAPSNDDPGCMERVTLV